MSPAGPATSPATPEAETRDRPPDGATDGSSAARIIVDGNEAAARVAHAVSEVISIYPITPASPMGELADAWSQAGRPNIWGVVPEVIELQSEAGAAGTVHGALQAGALTTTFTASQGLLLMIPNLYKIAGELTPAVIHVAARSVATHALSIFGDHSDVMAARQTGMALLASSSVQAAQDLALVAHAATLRSRVPFLHFFDGFRTSHEVADIAALPDEVLRAMIDDDLVEAHRLRALDPDRPVLRGSAQNPDVFFQARESANLFHEAVPEIVQAEMDRFASLTGRRYSLCEYHGAADADRVLVIMGSGAATVRLAVDALLAVGEKVGVVEVRLYRPLPTDALLDAIPTTATRVAVLDRTKEPGAPGDPLLLDVVATLAEHRRQAMPHVIGARYGLSSKEFTPAMAMGVFGELAEEFPRRQLTVGIVDDVTNTSVDWDREAWHEPSSIRRAVFHGLGSDGTVGANKNSVKIIGSHTPLHVQGYFVYDSKKSGSTTTSHLRFGPDPIDAPFLVTEADFVAVHHLPALQRLDLLSVAAPGATVLLDVPGGVDAAWDALPAEARRQVIDRDLAVWVVDAGAVARASGLGNRVNTVLQTCFFSLAGLLPVDVAIEAIKSAIDRSYARLGPAVLERNRAAVDAALAGLDRLSIPDGDPGGHRRGAIVPDEASDFVHRVTARMLAGDGDLLPVSALPVDGTFPTGTTRWERRSVAHEIPVWDPEICIDCARCALVCPHAAIRFAVVDDEAVAGRPPGAKAKDASGEPGRSVVVQVAPDDCTGCGVCVAVCPAKSRSVSRHKAIDMAPKSVHLDAERANWDWFATLPWPDRTRIDLGTVKGSQQATPLFEFSGACAGCGETPYLKLLTQQLGDRLVVANATGCSSIYGGNLPTTPWTVDADGRGPAWANSLFEDNAEFGLGIRLALDHHEAEARRLLTSLADRIGPVADSLLREGGTDEASIASRRADIARLRRWLAAHREPAADRLVTLADHLVPRSVWIVGGDGWAYDIGFGGLDHVLASGRDVNILVLDTEVYSNTGGQTSKATPRAAVAKFSAGGKTSAKKDLGMIAMAHGDVYVAHIALGANMTQAVKAMAEAAAHSGPSLVIAYSPCIAHGIDMAAMADHQKMAAASGYWPLYRYDPRREAGGDHGLHLDSRRPSIPFADFAATEARFAMAARGDTETSRALMAAAQRDIDDRWHLYEQMVEVERTARYGIVDDDDRAEDATRQEGPR